MIKNNKNFQCNREKLNDIYSNANGLFSDQNQINNFHNIIKMINAAETKIFINYTYIKPIIEKIHNNSDYEELYKYLNECICYLNEVKELLPKFIEIENYSLKSKYTKKYLEDNTETKKMLNQDRKSVV